MSRSFTPSGARASKTALATVGVDTIVTILITPDGKAYCHDYIRVLSELFIVEGLT